MSERTPEVRFGLAVSLEELLLLNSLAQESLESLSSCDWDGLLRNISKTTKHLTYTNPKALIGLDLSQVELDSLNRMLQGKYPAQDRPLTITHLIQRIENGIARFVNKQVVSNESVYPTYSELHIHVFANIGDEDNLISVKQFATSRDAQVWIDQMKIERPGTYIITSEMEMDQSA
jgi:hypothetical protein